jgi:hypothetical protein
MDMTVIDQQGRVFGRFNLIDAAVGAFVLLLLPIGYATFLLFRPARPQIDSVTRVAIGIEESRVAGGSYVSAKLKVRGSGFNPLLRARIGETNAVGFVFESPNSADVLVGLVPEGRHDLVLYDGVQEVARARNAIEIQAEGAPWVRAFGWVTRLDKSRAETLTPGFASEPRAPGAFRVVAIGPPQTARARLAVGTKAADLPLPDLLERPAEMLLRCDWPSTDACNIGGETLRRPPPVIINLPGGYLFEIDDIAPPDEATPAVAHLRLQSLPAGLAVGDRDAIISSSAAELTAINGQTITVKLGVHQSREGWRYRGQLLTPGDTLILRTDRHAISGTVIDVSVTGR